MSRALQMLTVLWLVLAQCTAFGQQRIWVDTDIASGKLRGDMDDAIALHMLLRDTSFRIAGISVVHGVDHAEKMTRQLLAWHAPQRTIEVHRGARSFKEFGQRNAAVNALEKALEAGPLIILALGPATNIGTVLQLRPDLWRNVQHISFCGGRRPGMVFSPAGKARFSDYNFDHDSVAARVMLQTNVPITLAGYDCSDSLFITHADYAHLQHSDLPSDRWFYKKMKRWEGFWRTFIGTDKGFIPFDCATLGILLQPEAFEVDTDIPAFVAVRENDTQHTIKGPTKAYLLVDGTASGRTVNYCHHAKVAFKAMVLRALH